MIVKYRYLTDGEREHIRLLNEGVSVRMAMIQFPHPNDFYNWLIDNSSPIVPDIVIDHSWNPPKVYEVPE